MKKSATSPAKWLFQRWKILQNPEFRWKLKNTSRNFLWKIQRARLRKNSPNGQIFRWIEWCCDGPFYSVSLCVRKRALIRFRTQIHASGEGLSPSPHFLRSLLPPNNLIHWKRDRAFEKCGSRDQWVKYYWGPKRYGTVGSSEKIISLRAFIISWTIACDTVRK